MPVTQTKWQSIYAVQYFFFWGGWIFGFGCNGWDSNSAIKVEAYSYVHLSRKNIKRCKSKIKFFYCIPSQWHMIVRTKAHMFYFTLFLTPSSKKCSRKYSNHYFKTLFFKFLYCICFPINFFILQSLLK